MDFGKIIEPLSRNTLPPEFLTSLLALLIMLVIALVIRVKLKHYDPLKKPSGFLNVVESVINFADRQVRSLMGPAFEGFGGYIICVGLYIFLGFFIGMIGIPNVFQPGGETFLEALPNPFTNLAFPLSIALLTFFLTHYTSIRVKKRAYFERYIEPIPVFLPINLVTMWSNVLSLTLRLFGNALAGYCVITLIYCGLSTAIPPEGSYWGMFFDPLIAPLAHLYFDIFDGAIQLAVFTMLTMINIAQEYISPQELLEAKTKKAERKRLKREKKELKKTKKLEKSAI